MFAVLSRSSVTMKDIEKSLKNCNYIKYAAYRTAAKLRVIQEAFYFDKLQLKVISGVFERHRLQQTENSVQLDQQEVEAVLADIFFAIKKGKNVALDVDYFSQLMFSLLLKVFGKKKSNVIQVLSFKVGLTLLCDARPREKYQYLFEQLADHNNCLSRKKLEILLQKMISLTEYLGEELSFGSDLIQGTVESCFQCNIGSLGLSEEVFMSWLTQDPQLLVWLSTLYRMQISDLVSHNAKCEICKVFPIVGLRYRCLRCLVYDMCQSCFFTGQLSKKHKLKHPVQEYCCPMTSQQSTKAFLLTLRNRLCKRGNKLQYLPALRVDSRKQESLDENTKLLDEMEISSKTVINGSRISLERFPYKELQNIILQLERETDEIIPKIDNFCSDSRTCEANGCRTELKSWLTKHSTLVRAQVQRLKLLRNYLASSGKLNAKAFLASTPVFDVTSAKLHKRGLKGDSVDLSPITLRVPGKSEETIFEKTAWSDRYLATYSATASQDSGAGTLKRSALEVFERRNEVDAFEEAAQKDGEGELSTFLGGKTLRELDSSFGRGTSWLVESKNGKAEEERAREENEETLEDLQCDLKRILSKLQELTLLTAGGEFREEEIEYETKKKADGTVEVDSLLVDLISGIDKLMGSREDGAA